MIEPDIEELPPLSVAPLLKQLVGTRVTSLVHYSWWPKEEVPRECECAKNASFSVTAGPLAVGFEDGTLLGVGDQDGLNSVTVWLVRWRGKVVRSPPTMDEDPDLFPIDARDPVYSTATFGDLVGRRLTALSVITLRGLGARYIVRPNEMGLCFSFEGGGRMVASHDLHAPSADLFAVIDFNDLPESTRRNMYEIPIA